MRTESSDCIQHFGYQDFKDFKTFDVDPAKLRLRACPIKDCSTNPVSISYRKSTKLFCPTHGIRLHSNTFVYWNGEEQKDQARLRNFRIRPDLACDIALRSVGKADS